MNTYVASYPQTNMISQPNEFLSQQQTRVLVEARKLFKLITASSAKVLRINSSNNNILGYLSTDLFNRFVSVGQYYFKYFYQVLGEEHVFDPHIQKLFRCFTECSGAIKSLPLPVHCQKDDFYFGQVMLIERHWNELRGRALVEEKTMTKAIMTLILHPGPLALHQHQAKMPA